MFYNCEKKYTNIIFYIILLYYLNYICFKMYLDVFLIFKISKIIKIQIISFFTKSFDLNNKSFLYGMLNTNNRKYCFQKIYLYT